ncbi:MAG TPA: OB-fold domain-containing protein [Caulobacterales bacterium]|nr:OB-fold domain-containing protein [Caulobacterales bacterium]
MADDIDEKDEVDLSRGPGPVMAEPRRYGPPAPNLETKPFWDACAKGKFLIKRCKDCGEPHYYPRALCPFCFSDKTEWEETSGEGEIYTFSVMYRGGHPYGIGYVKLKEGPYVLTNFVECDLKKLACGQKVKVQFAPTDGAPVPVFKPI